VSLFVVQHLLRREVEGDPDEQEAMKRAHAVAVMGDDILRDPAIERELALRAAQRHEPTGVGGSAD
jgi:hypothetical protein